MKKRLLLLALLMGTVGAAFGLGRFSMPLPIEPLPPLPPEIVEVEVVKEIKVPGPERVVERIVWRTKTVEVPVDVVKEITKWLTPDCKVGPETPPVALQADISVSADKYEGMTKDGRVAFGWRGEAVCDLVSGGERVSLAREPFNLSSSRAITTVPPLIPRKVWTVAARLGGNSDGGVDLGVSFHKKSRFGYYAGYSSGSFDETFLVSDFFGENEPLSFTESLSASRISAGVEFTFGRRYPISPGG